MRLRTLHLTRKTDSGSCEEYLKSFGHLIHSVSFDDRSGRSALLLGLVGQHCPNLRVLVLKCYMFSKPHVYLLRSCLCLESIDISSVYLDPHKADGAPLTTHHLRLTSIRSNCCQRYEEMILGMCDLLSVRRLQVTNMHLCDWHSLRNFRSLSFYENTNQPDNTFLTHVCTYCPQIDNLEIANGDRETCEIVVPATRVLTQLRTLCVEYQMGVNNLLIQALVECHSTTLEAVYLLHSHTISADSINRLLKECTKLHILSCNAQGVDYSLMSSLTTIIANLPGMDEWSAMREHCHCLQHLHFNLPWLCTGAPYAHIVAGAHELPALRTVYISQGNGPFRREIAQALRLQLPTVRFVEEIDGEWYKLFELPI